MTETKDKAVVAVADSVSEEKEKMAQLQAFRDLTPTMMNVFGSADATLTRLAGHCWSKGLIDDDIRDNITDSNYLAENKRAQVFVGKVQTRVDKLERGGDLKEAKKVMESFAGIIRATDPLYKRTADTIAGFSKASDFRENAMKIADAIQPSLMRIANAVYAKGLIDRDQYSAAADPAGKHIASGAMLLFRTLDTYFEERPNDVKEKFIPIIAKDMDDTTGVAVRLREAIFNNST